MVILLHFYPSPFRVKGPKLKDESSTTRVYIGVFVLVMHETPTGSGTVYFRNITHY